MKKLTIILCLGIAACNPQRKLEKTQLYLFKHPEFSAGYCAEQFPDKPNSVIVVSDTVMGAYVVDSLVTDTLLHDTTLIRTIVKTKIVTIRRDSIIYRENKAEQRRLELALLSCQDNNNTWLRKYTDLEAVTASWKGKAKKRWLWIALLIGGAVGVVALKIFGKFKPPFIG